MRVFPPGSVQERRTRRPVDPPFSSRGSRIMLVTGGAVMAAGAAGLLSEASRSNPDQWIRWFLGSLAAHDLVLAPLVFLIGALVTGRIPPPWRAWIQGALVASGIVTLTVFPFLRGYGRLVDNPSALPNDYARGLMLVVGAIWAVALTGAVAQRARRDHRG